MKKLGFILIALTLISCFDDVTRELPTSGDVSKTEATNPEQDEKDVRALLDQWHAAATSADFEEYFGLMTENSVFIGTDATENWGMEAFKEYSKPYFDRGRAWDFSPIERNIYLSDAGNTAWFDELLDTHMGICRGSGTAVLEDGTWKIAHYVLSMTVPNDKAAEVTELKNEIDSSLVSELEQD